MDGKLLRLAVMSRTNDKEAISFAKKILVEDASQVEAISVLAVLYSKAKK